MEQQEQIHTITIVDEHGYGETVKGNSSREASRAALESIRKADWGETPYAEGWERAIEEVPTPGIGADNLNAYIQALHKETHLIMLEIGDVDTHGWSQGHFDQHLANYAQLPLRVLTPDEEHNWLELEDEEEEGEDETVSLCDCGEEPCEFTGCDSHYPNKVCQSCCKDAYGDCPIKCPKCGERVAPTLPFDYIERRTRSSCGPETTGHCGACGVRWE